MAASKESRYIESSGRVPKSLSASNAAFMSSLACLPPPSRSLGWTSEVGCDGYDTSTLSLGGGNVMGVVDDVCSGLYELERWLVHQSNLEYAKFLPSKALSSRNRIRPPGWKHLQSVPCAILCFSRKIWLKSHHYLSLIVVIHSPMSLDAFCLGVDVQAAYFFVSIRVIG